MKTWEVLVGNVGTVHSGGSQREAQLIYACYVDRSQSGRGRCAGEPVTLLRVTGSDVEVWWEYAPQA